MEVDNEELEELEHGSQGEDLLYKEDEIQDIANGTQFVACSGCGFAEKKSFMVPTEYGESGLGWQGTFRCLCQRCYPEKYGDFWVIKKAGKPPKRVRVSMMTKSQWTRQCKHRWAARRGALQVFSEAHDRRQHSFNQAILEVGKGFTKAQRRAFVLAKAKVHYAAMRFAMMQFTHKELQLVMRGL